MNIHKNARLTPLGRQRTLRKWAARYEAEGLAGLQEDAQAPLATWLSFGGIFDAEIQSDGTILDATYNVAGKYCK